MASTIAHGLTACAVGAMILPQPVPRRIWVAGLVCAAIPDIDAIGRPIGMGDLMFLGGHRALTYSLAFAVVLGVGLSVCLCRALPWTGRRGRIATFLVLATASHGLLDTLANYGAGVQLLAPFSARRFAAPWRPVDDLNEILWVWLPASLVLYIAWRRRRA